MKMELEDYPLLNEPNIMLIALRTAAEGPATPDSCSRRLLKSLGHAGESPPPDLAPLHRRVETAFRCLSIAGLLDQAGNGRYVITQRGRQVLRDHPMGVDSSVLVSFPEFRSYIYRPRQEKPEKAESDPFGRPLSAYDEGYSASLHGREITDNPYEFDATGHIEWENGWSEAHEEDARRRDAAAAGPG
jgi:ribosome modulation factor